MNVENESLLAAGCGDGTIRIFHVSTGRLAYNLQSSSAQVTLLARYLSVYISCSSGRHAAGEVTNHSQSTVVRSATIRLQFSYNGDPIGWPRSSIKTRLNLDLER